jgi:hypothetical protein
MKNETLERFISAQNNLVVQHSDFSLRALHDMAASGSIELDPHYQRRDRWSVDRQSALIESFILNVPVPPVYLSEDDFGQYSVIDGKQRITAIRDFLAGKFRLQGVQNFTELEGLNFSSLPAQIQNALSVRPYIRVITLLKQTDPQLKYEVFLRLNTGGEKLLPQEIRNVAFSGPLNDLLFELSSNVFLRDRLKIRNASSPAYQAMEDVELVLRFFTFQEGWQNIGQSPSREMDRFMRLHRNAKPPMCAELRAKFLSCLKACEEIWGTHAFHKPTGAGWREQFIAPLYDAEMVAVSQFTPKQLAKITSAKAKVVSSFIKTFREDDAFSKSVNQATNNLSNVRKRITAVTDILKAFC